jgi:hypothetical protein
VSAAITLAGGVGIAYGAYAEKFPGLIAGNALFGFGQSFIGLRDYDTGDKC